MADDQKTTTEKYPVLYKEDLDAELESLKAELKRIEDSINSGERDLKQETAELAKLESEEAKLSQRLKTKSELMAKLDETNLNNKDELGKLKSEIEKLNEEIEILHESIDKLNPSKIQEEVTGLTVEKTEIKKRQEGINFILRTTDVQNKPTPFNNRLVETVYKKTEGDERRNLYNDTKNNTATADTTKGMFVADYDEAKNIQDRIKEEEKLEKLRADKIKEADEEIKRENEVVEGARKAYREGKKVGTEINQSNSRTVLESAPSTQTKERATNLVSKLWEQRKGLWTKLTNTPEKRVGVAILFTATLAYGASHLINGNKETKPNIPNSPKPAASASQTSKLGEDKQVSTPKESSPVEDKQVSTKTELGENVKNNTSNEQKSTSPYGEENKTLALAAEKLQTKYQEGYLSKFKDEIKNLKTDDDAKRFIEKHIGTKDHSITLEKNVYSLLSGDLSIMTGVNEPLSYREGNTITTRLATDGSPLTKGKAMSVYYMIKSNINVPIENGAGGRIYSSAFWDLIEDLLCLAVEEKIDPSKISDKYLEKENLVGLIKTIHREITSNNKPKENKNVFDTGYTESKQPKNVFLDGNGGATDENGRKLTKGKNGSWEYFSN